MNRWTFPENAPLLGDLTQLRMCILRLSTMGAVVLNFKSGPVVLIDAQHVPESMQAGDVPVQNDHHYVRMEGCTVIWKAITPTSEDV